MKNTMKVLTAMLTILLLSLNLSACAQSAEKSYTIGIAQFAEHPSLDNCREGFIQGLAEAGFVEGENVTFIRQNAQADMGLAQQIAAQMAQECDLVCAIATPMAQAAFNTCMDQGVPVVYTAVSDPTGAMLADADGKNAKAITGSCDLLPVEAQLKLIRAFLPSAAKIGILYTTSETNSESQLKLYQQHAAAYGFEIVPAGISTGADLSLALDSLLPNVDCLTNLTDNTVVSYLAVLLDKANAAGKPVFGSEIEQVKNGCIASEGVEYISLGKQTGALAAQVLGGTFAGELPFVSSQGGEMTYNSQAAAALHITIPEAEQARGTDVAQK
ncbi:MAG: ABC transporter substrate-binding protein [Clostridia bacterium]